MKFLEEVGFWQNSCTAELMVRLFSDCNICFKDIKAPGIFFSNRLYKIISFIPFDCFYKIKCQNWVKTSFIWALNSGKVFWDITKSDNMVLKFSWKKHTKLHLQASVYHYIDIFARRIMQCRKSMDDAIFHWSMLRNMNAILNFPWKQKS